MRHTVGGDRQEGGCPASTSTMPPSHACPPFLREGRRQLQPCHPPRMFCLSPPVMSPPSGLPFLFPSFFLQKVLKRKRLLFYACYVMLIAWRACFLFWGGRDARRTQKVDGKRHEKFEMLWRERGRVAGQTRRRC